MNSPKVSVIIPNYNHAPYLVQRINSVLEQTFQDFEVIILDDCSTDNSREVIEQYRKHPKVVHIEYNTKNSGSPFKQWNKGINLAKGEYIWIAESDDWADERFLDVLIKPFFDNQNIGIAYSDSLEINEKGLEIGKWSRWQTFFNENIWQNDFNRSGIEINTKYNYLFNIIPNASAVLFVKKLYNKSKYKNQIEKYKYTGDWWMWFSILNQSNVTYVHRTLNYFRSHPNTTRSEIKNYKLKATEYYKAVFYFKKYKSNQNLSSEYELRMIEIFTIWNPSLKNFLKLSNLIVLYWAIKTDSKITNKLLNLITSKL